MSMLMGYLFCAIGCEAEYFTLAFHYCDILVKIRGCMLYKNGRVDYFDYRTIDELSLLDLHDMV